MYRARASRGCSWLLRTTADCGSPAKDQPIVYVEASVFANEGHAGYGTFSILVASALRDVLGIPPEHTYVRYADIPVWSVAHMVVDRASLGGIRA